MTNISQKEFDFLIEEGINWALARIRMNYEHSPHYRSHLFYHDSRHTNYVLEKVEHILNTIYEADNSLVNKREIQLARFAAAFHDVFIKWKNEVRKDGEFVKVFRQRLLPDSIENEKASAGIAEKYMDIVNEANQEEIFSKEDKAVVREAIEITIPQYDILTRTVIQPKLSENTSVVARAIALADIGASGLDPEIYLLGGDSLFIEENVDILDSVKHLDTLPKKVQKYYRDRILKWTEMQSDFAKGRRENLERELAGLPEHVKEKLRELFIKFDESIKAAQEMHIKRQKMELLELMKDAGYRVEVG